MSINYLLNALMAFLVAGVLAYLLNRIARKRNFLMAKGVPLVGGIAMGVSFYIVYAFAPEHSSGIIISSLAILIFGIIDDWRELSIKTKFFVQIIATSVLIYSGVKTRIAYVGEPLNILITFIWVIGITNALNHLDIVDGVAAGVAFIIGLAFAVISFLNSDLQSLILSLALLGAVAGFLIYNLPPAKIYMGNSGSHFLGFILGSIALLISYAPLERKVALLSPLLILGLPIFDTALLVWLRLGKKKVPFKKSNDHLVLKFMALGFSKRKALAVMLALTLFFCSSGILVSKASNSLGVLIVIFVVLVSLLITFKMQKVKVDG